MVEMKRSLKITILFVLVAGLLLQLVGQAFSLQTSITAIQTSVKTVSPCHQSTSSSNHAGRYCQSGNNTENPTMLSMTHLFLEVISEKLFFIFLLGFVAILSLHRIEKPPKSYCYA